MATKLNNNEARLFCELLKNASMEEMQQNIFNSVQKAKRNFGYSEIQLKQIEDDLNASLQEALALFNKITFFEKPEYFAVNGWGYDQTNYENIKVIGQAGGCMICTLKDYVVFSVSKKNYTDKKAWTLLGGSRYTDWENPYTNKEIENNTMYNAYYGH